MIMTFLTKSSRQDGPKPNCTFSRETVNGKLEVVIMPTAYPGGPSLRNNFPSLR